MFYIFFTPDEQPVNHNLLYLALIAFYSNSIGTKVLWSYMVHVAFFRVYKKHDVLNKFDFIYILSQWLTHSVDE